MAMSVRIGITNTMFCKVMVKDKIP